jgi:hypothetical protein
VRDCARALVRWRCLRLRAYDYGVAVEALCEVYELDAA